LPQAPQFRPLGIQQAGLGADLPVDLPELDKVTR
jgi:hypothetical protein